MQNCNHRAFHQPYMHVVIAIFCSLLSMCYIASIFHVLTHFWAATFMLRTFQTVSKVPQVVILYSVMPLELMDPLIFQAFRCYHYQMALSHIYCNKFSFETFDVISVLLLLCYKSFKYCACQHYRSRDDTDAQRSDCLRSGRYKMVSEHTLIVGHDH